MAETLGSLSLSDLIRFGFPLNGTASFQGSSSRPPKRIKLEKSLLSNPNPSRKIFTPISIPVLLVGIANFVSEEANQNHLTSSCFNHCLSFSDSSSTVCCYIIDFDIGMIGQEIHLMAWNYLPIKQGHSQGVLEIIQWRFNSVDTVPPRDIPLSLELFQDSDVKARSSAFGVLKSVSLTSTLPIENGKTGVTGDSVGFLAEILTCLCHSCAKMQCLNEESGLHRFTESKLVYFIRPTHKWRPVFAKLVGKVMCLAGLRKKLIVVGTDSFIMLVSTIKTKVSLSAFTVSDLRTNHHLGGAYRGTVTGLFLHGAVIELDKKVWLLIHDTLLVPHHSLRIGTIVSVRNFHVVHTDFSWTKVIILGTCVTTSLQIDSFAFSDTRVFVKTEQKSLLGNFVESLKLSTKFWVLIMVLCFKHKFRTILSDKELLGSSNSAGLIQTYSSRSLPPDVFQPYNSMFTTFCNHNQCTYGTKSTGHDQTNCKLVVPLSNFVGKCEELWISFQSEISENFETCDNTCDGISYPSFIRRIIPSDDFGCILMGNIQTCSSGRLQLVDATGSIDVVIPDLPFDVNDRSIYEVRDYRLVLEGFRIEGDTSVYDFGEPLSCSAIFRRHTYRKKIEGLGFYVQFYLKKSICLTPSNVSSNLLEGANHGAHLLVISHKFPLTNNFSINPTMWECSTLFAEAFVFPCKFKFSENGKLIRDENSFQDEDLTSVSTRKHNEAAGNGPCLARCSRSEKNCSGPTSTLSEFGGDSLNCLVDANSLTRLLLEFKCESFSKYQLLRIGSYYLLNCSEGFGPARMCKCLKKGGSLVVTENNFRGIDLSFSNDLHEKEPSGTQVVLLKSLSELHEIMDFQSVSQGITKLLPPNHVLSVSSCVQLMFQSRIFCGSTDLEGQRLAQGDLISVYGNIEAFHVCEFDPALFTAASCATNSNQGGDYICIHLADDYQTVIIRGNLSRKLYPIGIGTGASATFHRLLLTCSPNSKEKLMLTPATYIEITSVREIKSNREPYQQTFRVNSLIESSSDIPALRLFSDLDNADSKVSQLYCRVLCLNVLVLESCTRGSVPAYKIPLAGFVLDDGSSVFNCWADDDKANTLLNLRGIRSSFFSNDFSRPDRSSRSLLASSGNKKIKVSYFLVHMLKKHHKVTVKYHGTSLDDISCQDLSFHSGSGKIFSILEKRFLNHIILSSCEGPTYSVSGVIMDENVMQHFQSYISESETLRGSLPNIYITEVDHIDPLILASSMLHDIKMR